MNIGGNMNIECFHQQFHTLPLSHVYSSAKFSFGHMRTKYQFYKAQKKKKNLRLTDFYNFTPGVQVNLAKSLKNCESQKIL